MFIYNFKKGISPVVAMALLLVVVVVSAIGFQHWYQTFQSNVFSDVELKTNDAVIGSLEINDLIGGSLYIINNIVDELDVISLKIGNNVCSLENLNLGMNDINVADCIKNMEDLTPNVILVTEKKIVSKRVLLHKKKIESAKFSGYTNSFLTRWDTRKISDMSSNKSQIKLPLEKDGVYNFTVLWGDGNSSIITSWDDINVTHNYNESGEYDVEIIGTFKGFRFNHLGDMKKIIEVKKWGNVNFGNNGAYFAGCENLESSAIDTPDLSGTTDLNSMFLGNIKFNGNINNWDVSNVEKMDGMFVQTIYFNQELNNWDVRSVKSMVGMFTAAGMFNQDLSSWNVSNVENMDNMFAFTSFFNGNITGWNVRNVKSMVGMFIFSNSFNQDISGWDVSNVNDMNYMFSTTKLFNQNIGSWNTSNVINMSNMFSGAKKFNQDLSSWNVSNVIDYSDFDTLAVEWVNLRPNFIS